jgi:hypothetical protein
MIIKDIKQKLNIFKREQVTSINWPDVIDESEIECAIDETQIDCLDLEAPLVECGPGHFTQGYGSYTGIPAPVYLEDDEWFGPAPIRSQKQIDYMEKEIEMKRQERKESFSVEPDDIHQKMYEIATKNHNTTLDLDPPGGSENFHTGPGGWNSGNGREQFS